MSDHPTRLQTPGSELLAGARDELIGEIISDRWRLTEAVGSGGMATVYAAQDKSGGWVAIKLMHPDQTTDTGLRQRFIREAELMSVVGHHPGAVKIYEFGITANGQPFIAMDLLVGESVSDVWKRYRKKLPVQLALDIGLQSLSFLKACHELGIFHRDLKPSNLFLMKDGTVKVLDFGIAHFSHQDMDLTAPGQALGTPAFMSPEQAAGRLDLLDQRSDIFSLGATLYTLLSGQRLHDASSAQQAFVLAATSQAGSLAR
ncbi:MAG: serine/threonine protein kinase, partial [Myxococcales bacterium]|nr:serine/threonine protein kinase [Myxococcales bacterium]